MAETKAKTTSTTKKATTTKKTVAKKEVATKTKTASATKTPTKKSEVSKKPAAKKSVVKKSPTSTNVVRENGRKSLVGTVISIKNKKTITVLVETYEKHPLYSKRFKKSKKFAVHDEKDAAKIGDVVRIQETRPISKTKHFRLVEIKSHAIGGNKNA